MGLREGFGVNLTHHKLWKSTARPITIAKSIGVMGRLLFPSGITQTASEMYLVMQ
ncbi:hypothetical protein [Nostoc sp.]|uniref:hypothetical protein n=1 Tax=Nostoc sp. TaxID=1180 RepID=UPI002FFA5D5E